MLICSIAKGRGQTADPPIPGRSNHSDDMPSGLAALVARDEELSSKINSRRAKLASLGEEYLEKQHSRMQSIRSPQGTPLLVQAIERAMNTLLRRMARLEQVVRELESEREQLGWRLSAERRRGRDSPENL